MQLKGLTSAVLIILGGVLAGCTGDSSMTSKEVDALKNPPKGGGPPPQAAEAMRKGAEALKIQNAGLDSRGVPIANSTLGNAPKGPDGPPPGSVPGGK